jgi:hypothetical protein
VYGQHSIFEGSNNMMTVTMPEPVAVGRRSAEILALVRDSDLYPRLVGASMRYVECWATFTGYPTIANWNLERDAGPLLEQALRVLCLKAAVYELTDGDEEAAELLVSSPVDEMIHAVLAQFTLMTQLQRALGVVFPHATELECFEYERGCYTDECWTAAGFGVQDPRYWLGSAEVERRLDVLNDRYRRAGISDGGRSHDITFNPEPRPGLVSVAG